MNLSKKQPDFSAEVTSTVEGERLDKFVTQLINDPTISRSQVQQWIKDGCVWVDGRAVKQNYLLLAGEQVELYIPEVRMITPQPENIPLHIVYEDEHVIVVNKSRGMVVHPAQGHDTNTLVNALLYHCGGELSTVAGVNRPGIVHRIDRDTSGLVVVAKNDTAHIALAAQLKAYTMERKYIAIVQGNPTHDSGTINAPIGRDPTNRKKYTVTHQNSKQAVTRFAVIERFADATLIECELETGRTHQLRVHFQFIGHSIIGDPLYSRTRRNLFSGQALHAAMLGFIHPASGEKLRFEAPYPEDMLHLLHYLRN